MKHSYKIISDQNPEALAARVENDLNTGWILHGPPFVIFEEWAKTRIAQAMISNQPGQHSTKKIT